MKTWRELLGEANHLVAEIKRVSDGGTDEEKSHLAEMVKDLQAKKAETEQAKALEDASIGLKTLASEAGMAVNPGGFKSLGDFLVAVHQAGDIHYRGQLRKELRKFADQGEKSHPVAHGDNGDRQWEGEFKDLAENTGATGGFLVQTEFLPQLLAIDAPAAEIRRRATVIPMRARQVQVPALDQTSTTAGGAHWFGGVTAYWTEEAGLKAQADPAFRQINLVAHKLVCYTRASDELLVDSAIGLETILRGPMGFSGAIAWEEEYTFLRGTGAGQPLGIINAGCTIVVPRASGAAITVPDLTGMLEHALGSNLVWHISRSQYSNLLQLNGPAANPFYIFIPNGRDGAPATLFGFPIIWSDKLPAAGQPGDVVLANWPNYYVGDRQATTIDSTNVERFRYDQTSWRAVHRVDGQPGLSAPITFQDGTTQVSPFVILGAKTT